VPGIVAAALCAVSGMASAATYPVSARLTLAPAPAQHCLKRLDGGPPDCRVVEEVHAAFEAVTRRMFSTSTTPDLELVLSVDDVDLYDTVMGGPTLDIRTTVRILSPQGKPIDEIHDLGQVTLTEAMQLDRAIAAAAQIAAEGFDSRYGRSGSVASYLVGNRIAPSDEVQIPVRSDTQVWAVAGGGVMQGGGDGDAVPSFSLQLGGTYRWFVLQGSYAHYSSAFFGEDPRHAPFRFDSSLGTSDLGIEGGFVVRPGRNFEIHAGPGVHCLIGSADGVRQTAPISMSTSKIAPTVFASLSWSFLAFRSGARFLVGADARGYFNTSVPLDQFGRTAPLANAAFGVFFGGELNLRRGANAAGPSQGSAVR
jgi:hypothetical protein